jgi:hypothetical protein
VKALSLVGDLPFIRLTDPRDDIHQRALADASFTCHREHHVVGYVADKVVRENAELVRAAGADGYLAATKKILEAAGFIKQGIREIPELRLLGDPLFVIAFTSDSLDIYKVLDAMTSKKWNLNVAQTRPVYTCA